MSPYKIIKETFFQANPVKVDHCLCTTDPYDENASPCNAGNCFMTNGCMACPGGDLTNPAADQFCQV